MRANSIAERLDKIPETEDYNKEEEFKEIILPQLMELKKLCNRYRLPFFFTCCVANQNGMSKYASSMISPMEFPTRLRLYDDQISKCLCAAVGFDLVYRGKVPEVEMDMNESVWEAKSDFEKQLAQEVYVDKTYIRGNKASHEPIEKREISIPKPKYEDLKPDEITVYEAMKENNIQNLKELASLLGKEETNVRYVLIKLCKKGYVEHVGPKKTGYWRVLK